MIDNLAKVHKINLYNLKREIFGQHGQTLNRWVTHAKYNVSMPKKTSVLMQL